MNEWYAVHTHAMAERKAEYNLLNQDFDVYLPCYRKKRRHARKSEWVRMPLFPRYLFVRLTAETQRWRAIHSTIGVSHLVCQGDTPVPVPQSLVNELKACESDRGCVELSRLTPLISGQTVNILEGPFSELLGIFERATDRDQAIVLLKLLGRHIRVKLPSAALQAAV